MDTARLTYSVRECACVLGISRGLCFQLVREGKIAHLRFNKRILIPKWAIDELLKKPHPVGPGSNSG